MKALRSHRAGGPERLMVENVAEPAVAPREVRTAVRPTGSSLPSAANSVE